MKIVARTGSRLALWLALLGSWGCHRDSTVGRSNDSAPQEVVVYCSLDEPDVAPLCKRFEEKTGIKVHAVTDTEATKTTVLVERLEAEKAHPQADVYWGNEIFHTINLAEAGFFEPYRPATAEDVPAKWRDKDNLYTCIGVRARVIAFSTSPENKELVRGLSHLEDLTDPKFKGKLGICHPGFGTASGHFAAMYVLWGEPKFVEVMRKLRANEVKLLGGNSVVADEIGDGNLVAGPTDNDDVTEGKENKQPIDGILPDQAENESGTLLIPGTIALLKGCAHPDAAKKFIDYMCRAEIEKELMDVGYLGYSVRKDIPVKAMQVSYVECAHHMRHAIETALTILQDRK
jgi:iron(III) transport system substrate-binding protein